MIENQNLINIEVSALESEVKRLHDEGYRLVQIGCTRLEKLEVNYSFDKNYEFKNLKVVVDLGATLPSVSGIYLAAFLYENEIHDLFGISFKNLAVDYGGNFYKTSKKFPFVDKG